MPADWRQPDPQLAGHAPPSQEGCTAAVRGAQACACQVYLSPCLQAQPLLQQCSRTQLPQAMRLCSQAARQACQLTNPCKFRACGACGAWNTTITCHSLRWKGDPPRRSPRGPSSSMASQEADQSRFAHLLQPIRELAANWDIDVARELEDYLVRARADRQRVAPVADTLGGGQETLEEVSFAFEGGPALNFSEGGSGGAPARALPRSVTPGACAQPRCSSRAPPACTAERWSTCTRWCTRRWTWSWSASARCRWQRVRPALTKPGRRKLRRKRDKDKATPAARARELLEEDEDSPEAFLALDDTALAGWQPLHGCSAGEPCGEPSLHTAQRGATSTCASRRTRRTRCPPPSLLWLTSPLRAQVSGPCSQDTALGLCDRRRLQGMPLEVSTTAGRCAPPLGCGLARSTGLCCSAGAPA